MLGELVLLAQLTQNPSPMVEHTREHPRLTQREPKGRRTTMPLGVLFLPERWKPGTRRELLIHFHGAPWIAEIAAEKRRVAAIAIQTGAGSSRYATPFRDDPGLFERILAEAERASGARFTTVTLSSWSAGYGAIREILRLPAGFARVDRVLAIDSIHAGYVKGSPGPAESELTAPDLAEFERFAREAAARRKSMLWVHGEIFPGTFASTTETADHVLGRMALKRKAVLRWGPMKTQQLSDTRKGRFRVLGFAGNSAPDHVDLLHGLGDFLKALR